MIQLKCKVCGGPLELKDGQVAQCQSCQSLMLLPAIDSDLRNDMFDRGNYYRMNFEFDRAAVAFEQIIALDPEDAEARFCLALCRYGVEYVRDPRSGEYKPTCHRSSLHSILEDIDYQAALKCAPPDWQDFYRKQAGEIHENWEQMMAIVRYEEPYDVFLCYKESPGMGIDPKERAAVIQRTEDSVLAQDLYEELTQRGVRVFFSRISLENKLGSAYEPYIFAALQSAKVMLVVGTRREYVEAVWVRNEWKRFLSLRAEDRSRELIPVLRGMDAYDLPDELAEFIPRYIDETGVKQDLLRGILKITGHTEGSREMIRNRELEKLADELLAQGNTEDALAAAQQMLNLNPENGAAYRIRFLAETRTAKLSDCGEIELEIEEMSSFIRMQKYAQGELKREVDELMAYRKKRAAYKRAEQAAGRRDHETAYAAFMEAEDYKDAAEQAEIYAQEGKKAKQNRILQENIRKYRSEAESARNRAETQWETLYPEMEEKRTRLKRQVQDIVRPKVFYPLLSVTLFGCVLIAWILGDAVMEKIQMILNVLLLVCLVIGIYRMLGYFFRDWGKVLKIFVTSVVVGGAFSFGAEILMRGQRLVETAGESGGVSVSVIYACLAVLNLMIALSMFFRAAKNYIGGEKMREEERYFEEVELPELKKQILERQMEELRGKYEPLIGEKNCTSVLDNFSM